MSENNKPTIKIVDATTGEEIIREMTEEEIAQLEKDKVEMENQIAAIEARKEARAEILAKLGLTEEEAKVLLG